MPSSEHARPDDQDTTAARRTRSAPPTGDYFSSLLEVRQPAVMLEVGDNVFDLGVRAVPPVGLQGGAGQPVGDERVVAPVGQQLAFDHMEAFEQFVAVALESDLSQWCR